MAGQRGCRRAGLMTAGWSGLALAQKPMTLGFIYVGPWDDYGYNQSHAEAVALLKKMPGLKIVEENVPGQTRYKRPCRA